MAEGARKNGQFKALSTAPTFNKTPVGGATPPIPYPVSEDLGSSAGTVRSVQLNGDPAYVLKQSTQPSCVGDAPGVAKGVKSSTVSGEVKPVKGSATVHVNKQQLIRNGDPCTLNGGNCPGVYLSQPMPPASSPDNAIPAQVKPQTPKETSFWSKASPWVHGVLGVASFVPGLSIATGAIDAGIYAAEGNLVEAGLSAAAMIPGGKIATTVGRAGKAAVNIARGAKAAEEAAQAAKAAKAIKEAEEAAKLAKAAEEAAEKANAARKAATKEAEEAATKEAKAAKKGKDNAQVKGKPKKVPCFHPFDKAKFNAMSKDEQKKYLKEMAKQLQRQEDAINSMTAAEYKIARDAFIGNGRNPAASALQESFGDSFRRRVKDSILKRLRAPELKPAAAERIATEQAERIASKLNALHDPDMVAGGWGSPGPAAMGRADVNSSIGPSWNKGDRLPTMDKAADDAIREGKGNEKMNVKLEVCRGKGMR